MKIQSNKIHFIFIAISGLLCFFIFGCDYMGGGVKFIQEYESEDDDYDNWGDDDIYDDDDDSYDSYEPPPFQLAVSVDGRYAPIASASITAIDDRYETIVLDVANIRIEESTDKQTWTERTFDTRQRTDDNLPISAALVLDYSSSMTFYTDKIAQSEAAAKAFLDFLLPGDRVALLRFAWGYTLEQNFTDDLDKIEDKIDSDFYQPDGTALWDAVKAGILLSETEPSPKAVIALTDGIDNASITTSNEIVLLANELGVPVYNLAITSDFDYYDTSYFLSTMQSVSQYTGGLCFEVPSTSQLETIYDAISNSFDESILATWTTTFPAGDPIYVKITVSATTSDGTFTQSVIQAYEY